MSLPPKKPSLVKQEKSTSSVSVHQDLLTELKQICLNAAERYVALRVPALTPALLNHLVEFVASKGLELVEHWGEEDIDPLSDADSDCESDLE